MSSNWSNWHECIFNAKGEIELHTLEKYAPRSPGIYAIAMKDEYGYQVQYIGMSRKSIYGRLKKHLTGQGNGYIKERLNQKRNQHRTMEKVKALYFMYLKTSKEDAQWMEALYVRGTVPIGNIQQKLSVPRALQNSRLNVVLED